MPVGGRAGFAGAAVVLTARRGAAGRRGSSEDDLPLQLNRAPDRGAERGLNSTPDERRPAVLASMTENGRLALANLGLC
jgi:hypothetical protein